MENEAYYENQIGQINNRYRELRTKIANSKTDAEAQVFYNEALIIIEIKRKLYRLKDNSRNYELSSDEHEKEEIKRQSQSLEDEIVRLYDQIKIRLYNAARTIASEQRILNDELSRTDSSEREEVLREKIEACNTSINNLRQEFISVERRDEPERVRTIEPPIETRTEPEETRVEPTSETEPTDEIVEEDYIPEREITETSSIAVYKAYLQEKINELNKIIEHDESVPKRTYAVEKETNHYIERKKLYESELERVNRESEIGPIHPFLAISDYKYDSNNEKIAELEREIQSLNETRATLTESAQRRAESRIRSLNYKIEKLKTKNAKIQKKQRSFLIPTRVHLTLKSRLIANATSQYDTSKAFSENYALESQNATSVIKKGYYGTKSIYRKITSKIGELRTKILSIPYSEYLGSRVMEIDRERADSLRSARPTSYTR